MSYLSDLTIRLAVGAAALPAELRQCHLLWLQAQQQADGGFGGREGGSDPYYTAFALRGLLLLDGIDDTLAQRVADYVNRVDTDDLGVVDRVSWVMAASILALTHGWDLVGQRSGNRERIVAQLEALRCPDGGYAKTAGGAAGSTYQTFLNLLCYELLEFQPPDQDGVVQFLAAQRMEDGGFREIRVAKRAGVNPTAAGIGALKTLGVLDRQREQATIDFLADMATDEGGMSANDRISMADLLSSCTGLVTLCDLEAADQIDLQALRRYALTMQRFDQGRPAGGFHGFAFDAEVDVEYSFYGLALLALVETCWAEGAATEPAGDGNDP